MPGVLRDEQQQWSLESLSVAAGGAGGGSLYESMVDYEPVAQQQHSMQSPSQHAMRRLNSFSSGTKDAEVTLGGLAQSSPHLFQRSHSFGGGGGGGGSLHAFNFFASPPSSPAAKSDLGMSLLDGVDECLNEGGSVKGGFFDESGKGSGRPDLRGLTFSGSSLGGSIVGSPTFPDSLQSFNKFLPSNNEDEEAWPAVDMYGCDQFRMFEFKVRRCMRGRSHDWTECPFAHPGEKARRRDPRRFHYSGTACPDFRKGSCRRGDACEFAHGVFECWLHPARYRTQPCKDGRNCRRRVCFFAHTPEQLRLLPAAAQAATAAVRSGTQASSPLGGSYDGSPRASAAVAYDGAYAYEGSSFDGAPSTHVGSPLSHFSGYSSASHSGHCCVPSQISSPTSTLVGHAHSPPPLSPPLSPSGSPPLAPSSPNGWPATVVPNFPSMSAGQAVMSQAALQATLSQGVYSRSQSSHSMGAAGHVHSPSPPAHRRHLDRLNSMPTLSIPSGEHRNIHSHAVGMPGSAPSSPSGVPQKSMLELIATLQQLDLRSSPPPPSAAQWLQQHYSSGPSPLRRCSQSVPGTPTKMRWEQKERWEIDENEEGEPMVQRVESGRDLRAKIYGRLGKDPPMDAAAGGGDIPDLGWVNELVKEEPEQSVAW